MYHLLLLLTKPLDDGSVRCCLRCLSVCLASAWKFCKGCLLPFELGDIGSN